MTIKWKTYTLVIVFLISGLAQGLNMFKYPYYENDEGTYMSQAWSFLTSGKLSPYQYTFDHAPLGWIFISGWAAVTGGFNTFGSSINSGRVFMLVLHLISAFFLYKITSKLAGNWIAGLIAVLIFSLSPLAIYYQRRVLLDNISMFWVLFSIYISMINPNRKLLIVLSGILYGIAVLTKETSIIFMPAFLYSIYIMTNRNDVVSSLGNIRSKNFTYLFIWVLTFGFVVSLYPVIAFLSGEGPILIDMIKLQLSQHYGGVSDSYKLWVTQDPLLIYVGLGSLVINFILCIKQAYARIVLLFSLTMLAYLALSKSILEFYIIPLIPFIGMSIGYVFSSISARIGKRGFFVYLLLLPVFGAMLLYYSRYSKQKFNIYTTDQTGGQVQATQWLKDNIPAGSKVIIDNYNFVDLNNDKPYLNRRFDYYWKVDSDPGVTNGIYNNSWKNVDYLEVTPQLTYDVKKYNTLQITSDALNNLKRVRTFPSNGWNVDIFSK